MERINYEIELWVRAEVMKIDRPIDESTIRLLIAIRQREERKQRSKKTYPSANNS